MRCGEGEALQTHVFAVADDRHPTLRVLFEAFAFARHVCKDQLGVQRIVVVLNQQVLFASDVERLGVVFDARALGDEQGRLALGFAGGDEAHLRVFGVGAGNDYGGTVGAHGCVEPHGVVRFLVDQVVFGVLSDVVHVDTPGAPRFVGDEVDELLGVVDEEGARRNVGDGVFEEGAGFHVEEALLVAFVALLVHGDAQQLAVTCRLEATEGEELHVLGVFVAVEDDDFTFEYFAGGDGRRGVAHHFVAFVQGGVAVEDGVLTAGHHAAVVPPVTDTVRDGQIRQQGAVLDFVEDGFAEGLLVCGDSFGVFGFCLEVVEDLFAFLVAEPFVGVDEDVAVVFAAVLDLLRYGRGEVLFSHAATSFIGLWVCEWCVPSAPAFLCRRVAVRVCGGVWARLVLVYRRVRQATILPSVRDCPAQLVEASQEPSALEPRRDVYVRRLVGAPLNGHKGAATRLIRLREGAVALPVFALLRPQAQARGFCHHPAVAFEAFGVEGTVSESLLHRASGFGAVGAVAVPAGGSIVGDVVEGFVNRGAIACGGEGSHTRGVNQHRTDWAPST